MTSHVPSSSRHIQRRAFDDIPPDAIVLSESEVTAHYANVVDRWKPYSDLLALKFGHVVLGSVNLLATFHIASYYRRRVKLPPTGYFSYYTITAGFCGFATTVMHHKSVHDAIFLQKECVECNYARAAALQGGAFFVCGILSSCFVTAISANNMNTYPVAGFESWAKIKESVSLYAKFSAKISYRLALYTTITILLACAITWQEYNEFDFLYENVMKNEAKTRAFLASLRNSKGSTNN